MTGPMIATALMFAAAAASSPTSAAQAQFPAVRAGHAILPAATFCYLLPKCTLESPGARTEVISLDPFSDVVPRRTPGLARWSPQAQRSCSNAASTRDKLSLNTLARRPNSSSGSVTGSRASRDSAVIRRAVSPMAPTGASTRPARRYPPAMANPRAQGTAVAMMPASVHNV